jgi:hypothetical protein
MLDVINNILRFPREWLRERSVMHDSAFRVLQNASVVKGPSAHVQHAWSSPAAGAACDFPHFDLYQCRITGVYYVRQTGGLLGDVIWYIENDRLNARSTSADAQQSHEKNS